MEKITKDTVVSTTEAAAVLGVTARRVQQLVQDGTLKTAEGKRGKLNLADAVKGYFTFLTKDTANMEASEAKAERKKKIAEASLKESKAKIAELEVKEIEGKMHLANDVEVLTNDLIYSIRSALIALPGRLAVDVAAVNTPAEASEIIKREVYAVMRELAGYRYDAEKYEERVKERMEWELENEETNEQ